MSEASGTYAIQYWQGRRLRLEAEATAGVGEAGSRSLRWGLLLPDFPDPPEGRMTGSKLIRDFGIAFVWFLLRPPRRAEFSVRAVLRRAAWPVVMPVAVVPFGLGLVAWIERYPDHPVARVLRDWFRSGGADPSPRCQPAQQRSL